MRFKIVDGIDRNEVYWLLHDIRWGFQNVPYLTRQERDWKIEYWDAGTPGTTPPSSPERIPAYEASYARGDIHTPIVVRDDNMVIDGQHKLTAQRNLSFDKVAVASPVGSGVGKVVKDEVYQPLVEGFKPKKRSKDIRCVKCTGKLIKPFPLPKMVNGIGKIPFLECERCDHRFVYEFFLGWAVVKV